MKLNLSPPAQRIAQNLANVRGAIGAAARRAGRDPGDVRLVAVTKYVDVAVIEALMQAGVQELGESRVQQLVARAEQIAPGREASAARFEPWHTPVERPPRWHMIGHLQRNKVRALLKVCRILHSLDSRRLAEEVEREAERIEAQVDAFLEINVSGEASKEGADPAEATGLAEFVSGLRHVRLVGLMTMAPLEADPERARPFFARLRELRDELLRSGAVSADCRELSMGMSNDYAVAVEEGATVVRVGSALFEGASGEAVAGRANLPREER